MLEYRNSHQQEKTILVYEPVCAFEQDDDGTWHARLGLGVDDHWRTATCPVFPPESYQEGKHLLIKVWPGVWRLFPLIGEQGLFTTYLLIIGVPEPAPWEA